MKPRTSGMTYHFEKEGAKPDPAKNPGRAYPEGKTTQKDRTARTGVGLGRSCGAYWRGQRCTRENDAGKRETGGKETRGAKKKRNYHSRLLKHNGK